MIGSLTLTELFAEIGVLTMENKQLLKENAALMDRLKTFEVEKEARENEAPEETPVPRKRGRKATPEAT